MNSYQSNQNNAINIADKYAAAAQALHIDFANFFHTHTEGDLFFQQKPFHYLLQSMVEKIQKTLINAKVTTDIIRKNEMLVFAEATSFLFQTLATIDDEKIAKQKILAYGKKIQNLLTEDIYQIPSIDKILLASIGLKIHELDLWDLDQQILRIENTVPDNSRKAQFDEFVTSLHHLRETIFQEMNDLSKSSKKWAWQDDQTDYTIVDIIKSDACQQAKETTQMLQKLTLNNREEDKKTIVDFGRKFELADNRTTTFFKAAWSTVLAGLGFILGAAIGCIVGTIAGGGISSILTAPIGLAFGGQGGAQYGRDLGKWSTGLKPYQSTIDGLLCKPSKELAAKSMSSCGLKLFDHSIAEKKALSSRNESCDIAIAYSFQKF